MPSPGRGRGDGVAGLQDLRLWRSQVADVAVGLIEEFRCPVLMLMTQYGCPDTQPYTNHRIEAKLAEERAWLGEVSAVVLQKSLRDLEAAYRNFFDGMKGRRPRMEDHHRRGPVLAEDRGRAGEVVPHLPSDPPR